MPRCPTLREFSRLSPLLHPAKGAYQNFHQAGLESTAAVLYVAW